MQDERKQQDSPLSTALGLAVGLPWFELAGQLWKIGRKLMRGLSSEGVYEVLDYECRLELRDTDGRHASVQKREKVRYLQDYITTFQDQAWGNGRIFVDYRCSPGIAVDQYQSGRNTYKLISLRELKNKGDVDEFNTEWKVTNGFRKSAGFWGTSINHSTRKVTVKVVFPRGRSPRRVSMLETNLQRTHVLGPETRQNLPDARTLIVWEKVNPLLYEDYILQWDW